MDKSISRSVTLSSALLALLLSCGGCATQHRVHALDAKNPELRMTSSGIYMGAEQVAPKDVLDALKDAEVPKDRAIHILLDRDLKDLRAPRLLMAALARGGYTRSVLMTQEHGASANQSGKSYAKEMENAQRSDDYIFYVTEQGVTYGILTAVGPDDVTACLQNDHARADSLIRICGQEKDFQSERVMPLMLELEDRLRKAGYVNIRRFWLRSTSKTGDAGHGTASPMR